MIEIALRHRFAGGFSVDVDFAAPSIGVTALFGPSGGGKSTVLGAVAGLLRPDAGRVALGGTAWFDSAAGIAVPAERRRCGVVFQDARLFPHLTVAGNLRYGMRRAPRAATGPSLEEVAALLGIEALLGRRPIGLSGGERQRVALGRALLSRPRLLLMDEPLAALDLPRRAEVLPYLARLVAAARLPVLYVTHALEEVDALAETLVLIEAGRVAAAGPVEVLATRGDLPLLARRRDAGALIGGTVVENDAARGITRVAFDGGVLLVSLRAEPPGTRVRLRLRARDVAVAIEPPARSSISNVVPCTLRSIDPAAVAEECTLQLMAGSSVLLARVSRDSVSRLALRPGAALFALVKATAFDRAPAAPVV